MNISDINFANNQCKLYFIISTYRWKFCITKNHTKIKTGNTNTLKLIIQIFIAVTNEFGNQHNHYFSLYNHPPVE